MTHVLKISPADFAEKKSNIQMYGFRRKSSADICDVCGNKYLPLMNTDFHK